MIQDSLEKTHFEAEAVCISAARAAGRFMSWVVLRTEQWKVLIPDKIAVLICVVNLTHLPSPTAMSFTVRLLFLWWLCFFFVLQWYHFSCNLACQVSEMILVMSVTLPQKYLKVLQFHKITKTWGVYGIYRKRGFIFWCLGQTDRYRTKLCSCYR